MSRGQHETRVRAKLNGIALCECGFQPEAAIIEAMNTIRHTVLVGKTTVMELACHGCDRMNTFQCVWLESGKLGDDWFPAKGLEMDEAAAEPPDTPTA